MSYWFNQPWWDLYMPRLSDGPDEETIYDRYRARMKELERLAAKRPCQLTNEQWDAIESWNAKEEEETMTYDEIRP